MSGADVSTRIRDALDTVRDPCMTSAGLNLSIIDLGLLRDVRLGTDHIDVDVTLTEPGCPFAHRLLDDIHRALDTLQEGERMQLNIVWIPPWTPDDMQPEARRQFDSARRRLSPSVTQTIPLKEIQQ